MRARRVAIGVAALVAVMLAGVEARAASWLELNFWLSGPRYDAIVPVCNDAGALGKIQARFAHKEGRFWNSTLRLVSFDQIQETAFRPWADDSIPRRFCSAAVLLSDGLWRTVHYSIIEDGGMIGATYTVEWCVVGLDRNWAYNPACKMARP
jgi:hypothetical protein